MSNTSTAREITIWTDARRAASVSAIIQRMGPSVRTLGVGGARSSEVATLARSLGATMEDDFRKLMVDHPAAFLLLASMDGLTRDDVLTAASRGTVVLTLEPLLADFNELKSRAASAFETSTGRVVTAPSFMRSPGWTGADPAETVGTPQHIGLASFGRGEDSTLYALLHDAWRVVLQLTGLPESIDASLTGPLAGPPENLRGLTGHFAVHARLPGGAAAVLEISDRAATFARRLRVMGTQGSARATNHGYQLCDATGKIFETQAETSADGGFGELVAAQWMKLLDRPDLTANEPSATEEPDVLACCLACLLSARTGQPENPGKLVALR